MKRTLLAAALLWSPMAAAQDVVINELLPAAAGDDADGKTWVELYNAGSAPVVLTGWKIQSRTQGDGAVATEATIDGGSIAAGGFFVVADEGVTGFTPDATSASMDPPNGTDGDGLFLVDGAGQTVDVVVYGSSNGDGIVDESGAAATSLVPMSADDQSIGRRADGVDTNLSGDDFHVIDVPTPGAPNPEAPPPPVCEEEAGWVVVNELLPNPAGADGGLEWVELYNAHATDTLRLDGWTLRIWSNGDEEEPGAFSNVKLTFPSGVALGPGGHLLVGDPGVAEADHHTPGSTLGLGNGTRGDGLRLVDCEGNVADTVVYGDAANEDLVVDDTGAVATSLAPGPGDGASLARRSDGRDTDDSGADFLVSSSPTPGAANPTFTCTPSAGDVLLNEILPDPAGSDGETAGEFVELHNEGGGPVALDGWQIVTAGQPDDATVDVLIPPASTVGAGGFFVVGNANVAAADYHVTFSIGNGSGGDAVRLLDCTGAVVDVVVYGSDNEDGMTDESGAVAVPADKPGSDQSLARSEDGSDTNQASDWLVDASPSPGATNVQAGGGGGGGDDEPRGCGRKDDAPGAPPPGDGGCATVPLPFGGLALLPVLVALHRRRGAA